MATAPRPSTATRYPPAWLLLSALVAWAPPTWAADAADAATATEAPPDAAPEATIETLEATRRTVRSTTEWLARGVDSWFGPPPTNNNGHVSDGVLRLGWLQRQDVGSAFSVRFNAHVSLPNAGRFAYVFVGRADQRETVTDLPAALSRQDGLLRDRPDDTRFLAGVGVAPDPSLDFRLGFRGGLKPYGQAQYKRAWDLPSGSLASFRETLFWSLHDHFGSTTVLSLEKALSSQMAVRGLLATTVTQELPKLDWSGSLGTYRAFGEERLLSLEALAHGTQGSGVGVTDYGLQMKWEQPVYHHWLSAEFLGGYFWPRPEPTQARGQAWAAGVTLKMRF
jgi:hypothetical protein